MAGSSHALVIFGPQFDRSWFDSIGAICDVGMSDNLKKVINYLSDLSRFAQ